MLGVGVIASSWLWAGLLQRFRGGDSLALLNALLAVATAAAGAERQPGGGLRFGARCSARCSCRWSPRRRRWCATTSRRAAWAAGIGAFTIVFAAGQIVGPVLVGCVADAAGGLESGLAVSALVLAGAALLAWLQKPLAHPAASPAESA